MNETIVIGGLILLLGIIFYLLMRQGSGELRSINRAVRSEAKIKGLQIRSIISPSFKEWKNAPFASEIKVGGVGFEGIPYNREFYRVIRCLDTKSSSERTIWVRATKSSKTGALTLEWKEV